jgi:hypothetical protein
VWYSTLGSILSPKKFKAKGLKMENKREKQKQNKKLK